MRLLTKRHSFDIITLYIVFKQRTSAKILTERKARSNLRGEEQALSTRFDAFVGNEALKSRLAFDVDNDLLSHAYILEGQTGSGKKTLALSIVAALSCQHRGTGSVSPCLSCKNCKKIMERKSPDVAFIRHDEDRVTIGVETVRDLKNDIYTAPNDLDVKAYIIEEADRMTEAAQNAFLLILESPPPYVMFFLACESSASLLETIRSRAPTLRMEKLSDADVEDYLVKNDARARQLKADAPHTLSSVVFCGNGSIGASAELLEPTKFEKVAESCDFAKRLISLISSSDKAAAFKAINSLGTKRADICVKLKYVQAAIRDLIMLKKGDVPSLCFFEDKDEALELATRFSSASLFTLYDATVTAVSSLEANHNVRITLISMIKSAGIV